LKQRQQQVDRADAVAPTYAAGDANYVNAAMAQRSAVNTSQADLNVDADSMATAQSQLDKQRNDLTDLQKTEPVLWVVTSGLSQGGLHVEVVAPQQ
jgi:peptidoglycan hydrolase CwlO-like protein